MAPAWASVTRIADDEIQAAPMIAVSTGWRPVRPMPSSPSASALAVMTVSPYGTDMSHSVVGGGDSGQSHFDADQIEAMTGCVELINTGRGPDGDELRGVADLQALADKYAFAGVRGVAADVPLAREYRSRLDAIVTSCEADDEPGAIAQINALLAQTGASPQVVAHDGRGPHLHVSRPTAPLADRMAAHFAMGLAWLVI